MLPFKTILHPTDFSDPSEHARTFAEGLARDYGAKLLFLHAVEPPVYSNEVAMNEPETEEYCEEAHQRIAGMTATNPKLEAEAIVIEGLAASEIVRIAGERQCDTS